jgi:hypothetical protein
MKLANLLSGFIHFMHFTHLSPAGVCGDPFEGGTGPGFWANKPFNQYNIALPAYSPGSRISITVDLSANHGGKFGFGICPRTTNLDQACFDQNPLTRVDVQGAEKWFWMMTGEWCCCENVHACYWCHLILAMGTQKPCPCA